MGVEFGEHILILEKVQGENEAPNSFSYIWRVGNRKIN